MEPSRAWVPLHHTPPYTRSGVGGDHLVLIKQHSARAGMEATQGGEGEVGRGMEAARARRGHGGGGNGDKE